MVYLQCFCPLAPSYSTLLRGREVEKVEPSQYENTPAGCKFVKKEVCKGAHALSCLPVASSFANSLCVVVGGPAALLPFALWIEDLMHLGIFSSVQCLACM